MFIINNAKPYKPQQKTRTKTMIIHVALGIILAAFILHNLDNIFGWGALIITAIVLIA